MTGHTVLAIPVPGLDEVVRERTRFNDPSFVSVDDDFVHAHVTVHAPWVDSPTAVDLETVTSILAATRPFEVTFDALDDFPDGTIYLRPEPADQLCRLSEQVADAFPHRPRYGGRFGDPVPHLTLDRRSDVAAGGSTSSAPVTTESVLASVTHLLPLRHRVDRVDLQWWANDDCRLLRSWGLT